VRIQKRNVPAAVTSDDRVEAVRRTVGLCPDIVFAAALGVSKATIYRLTRQGLPTVQIGGNRWINPERAAAWLAENAQPRVGRPRGRGAPKVDPAPAKVAGFGKAARDRDRAAAAG
jgi:hypothetical protein